MGAKRPSRGRGRRGVAASDGAPAPRDERSAPAGRSAGRLTADELGFPERVICPFCEKDDTELHSPFGSALSVATYWCNRCRTAFEWIKWDER